MLGPGPVLQAPEEGGQGQYGEVPAAYAAVAAGAGTPQLCRRGCGCSGRTGRPAQGAPRGTHHQRPGGSAQPGVPTEVPRLLLLHHPEVITWTSAGQQPSSHWTQGQRMRNIRRVSPVVGLTHRPSQLSPRANQPLCRRRGGRQFRKPGAKGCLCGRSRGNWESTEPPSRNTWMPQVPRGGGPG